MMKRILLLTVFLISACASGPRYSFESQWVDRQDGVYGDWTTSNNSNEFNVWTSSRVLGSKGGLFSNQSYIEVQSGRNTNTYVGINIGDRYICGDSIVAKMAWEGFDGQKKIESTYLRTSKNNEELMFSKNRYAEPEQNRFIHMLNIWDKLTIQTEDTCGEVTIVRFGIEGTHHMTTTETSPEGITTVTKSEGTVNDHIKYHKKGKLGFDATNLTKDEVRSLGRDTGIKITQVSKGYPADNAGLMVGDYLIFINTQAIFDLNETTKYLLSDHWRKQTDVVLTVIRNGQTKEIEVDL